LLAVANDENATMAKRAAARQWLDIGPEKHRPVAEQALKFLDLTVFKNPYLSWMTPNAKQAFFLTVPTREALIIGDMAGKTAALLASALQFVRYPGYAALILRRNFTALKLPGGLIDQSKKYLATKLAKWNGAEHRWTFPSGAVLQFGCIQNEADCLRYLSARYQTIGFDELAEFPDDHAYLRLLGKLRKDPRLNVPLRMRSASNRDGVGYDWVTKRFVTDKSADRTLVDERPVQCPTPQQ
jgi:hypothetical protein